LTDDFIDRFAIVGPPDRCIERLRSLAALGLDKVAIRGAAAADDIAVSKQLVTREVLPGMRQQRRTDNPISRPSLRKGVTTVFAV